MKCIVLCQIQRCDGKKIFEGSCDSATDLRVTYSNPLQRTTEPRFEL